MALRQQLTTASVPESRQPGRCIESSRENEGRLGALDEDGIYDVRNLYPPCFYRHVTRMPVELALNEGPREPEQEEVFDLTEYLRSIDV
jgi:hypothetical protein